jgi:formate hydrogenlyase subunit 3/multisubunit Na+/H+ antiporter MnhD subunit
MNILDVLLPTIVLTICSILTVPLLRFIRKRKLSSQGFMLAWMIFSFSAAAIGVVRLASEYFSQPQSSIQISSTDTILAPLSTAFFVDTVSVYMVIAYLIAGSISCIYGILHISSEERLSERY